MISLFIRVPQVTKRNQEMKKNRRGKKKKSRSRIPLAFFVPRKRLSKLDIPLDLRSVAIHRNWSGANRDTIGFYGEQRTPRGGRQTPGVDVYLLLSLPSQEGLRGSGNTSNNGDEGRNPFEGRSWEGFLLLPPADKELCKRRKTLPGPSLNLA